MPILCNQDSDERVAIVEAVSWEANADEYHAGVVISRLVVAMLVGVASKVGSVLLGVVSLDHLSHKISSNTQFYCNYDCSLVELFAIMMKDNPYSIKNTEHKQEEDDVQEQLYRFLWLGFGTRLTVFCDLCAGRWDITEVNLTCGNLMAFSVFM